MARHWRILHNGSLVGTLLCRLAENGRWAMLGLQLSAKDKFGRGLPFSSRADLSSFARLTLLCATWARLETAPGLPTCIALPLGHFPTLSYTSL